MDEIIINEQQVRKFMNCMGYGSEICSFYDYNMHNIYAYIYLTFMIYMGISKRF